MQITPKFPTLRGAVCSLRKRADGVACKHHRQTVVDKLPAKWFVRSAATRLKQRSAARHFRAVARTPTWACAIWSRWVITSATPCSTTATRTRRNATRACASSRTEWSGRYWRSFACKVRVLLRQTKPCQFLASQAGFCTCVWSLTTIISWFAFAQKNCDWCNCSAVTSSPAYTAQAFNRTTTDEDYWLCR